MDATTLRSLQAPLKQKYRDDPGSARIIARAEALLSPSRIAAELPGAGLRVAGLHQAAGGTGTEACSADMLLEALVACAAVTLMAVATSMGCRLTGGKVLAQGVWDARGTLGVDKTAPVGLQDIEITFELDGELDEPTRQRLIQLTERYCVILATLRNPPKLSVRTSAPDHA
jgi:uncharacterized OsmC-like protein